MSRESKLRKYWREQGFNSSDEFLAYQYLCGNIRSKKKINKMAQNKRFENYESWREHIEEILGQYDRDRRTEFYHFAKLSKRQCDISMGMHTSAFAPFMVALIAGILTQGIVEIVKYYSKNKILSEIEFIVNYIGLILLGALLFFILIIVFYILVIPYIESKNEVSFWADCLEIVEEYNIRHNEE